MWLKQVNNLLAHFTQKFVVGLDLTIGWSRSSNDAIRTQFFTTSQLCLSLGLFCLSQSFLMVARWLQQHKPSYLQVCSKEEVTFPVASLILRVTLIWPAWVTYNHDLDLGKINMVVGSPMGQYSDPMSWWWVRCQIKIRVCARTSAGYEGKQHTSCFLLEFSVDHFLWVS